MRRAWAVARTDLRTWRRSPWAVVAALVPPVGMLALVMVLTWSVTKQPVALVVEGRGPQAALMAHIITADREAYQLRVTDLTRARRLLQRQEVAAVIVVPASFDSDVATGRASLDLTLNNVDIDFGDDIRRAVDRSVAEFDAPQLGASLERTGAAQGLVVPNPYRVDVAERDLRRTTVTYSKYQAVPVVILLVLNMGVLGAALLGARDRERGTTAFLRATPIRPVALVAGRLAGTALATVAVLAPAIAVLTAIHVVAPPPGHWPALVTVLLLTTLLAAATGVLVGAAVRQVRAVAVVAITASSYLFFLGGGFTTIAFLPEWLRALSRVVPTSYAIDAVRQALFYPGLHGVGTDLLALSAFTAAAVAGGARALRAGAVR
ncbi:MAG TPA: ABC transporter permease [Acidimicrobiales bacterium]|nr:ABC transporter permease [Acidimicrobiales bacterium]